MPLFKFAVQAFCGVFKPCNTILLTMIIKSYFISMFIIRVENTTKKIEVGISTLLGSTNTETLRK